LKQSKNDYSEWVPAEGKITFSGVDLKYQPHLELVLKNLCMEIEPGMKVGIVGRTGSGKSTIGLALTRIVEVENGLISIDGVDIAQIPLHRLRDHLTVI